MNQIYLACKNAAVGPSSKLNYLLTEEDYLKIDILFGTIFGYLWPVIESGDLTFQISRGPNYLFLTFAAGQMAFTYKLFKGRELVIYASPTNTWNHSLDSTFVLRHNGNEWSPSKGHLNQDFILKAMFGENSD